MTAHLTRLFALAGVAFCAACGPGTTPAGQPPMVELSATTMQALQEEFNQASDQVRVILLLSPT